MNTFVHLFEKAAADYPSRIALHHLGRDWSYAEISAWSRAVAIWLCQHGLESGSRVALVLPNSAEYVAAYLGVMRAGGVVVGLNPESTIRELTYTLRHCDAAAVVTTVDSAARVAAAVEDLETVKMWLTTADEPSEQGLVSHCVSLAELRQQTPPPIALPRPVAEDIAQINYTSGTSGHPKGVTLTHRNLFANCKSIVEYLSLDENDSVMVILPFFYSYGNSLLLTHLAIGGRMILNSNFVFWNQALDLMIEQRATGFAGVPSSYAMLLHKSNFRRREFSDLRYLTCAGGALLPPVVEQLRGVVPNADIFLMYGQTEATARLSTLMPRDLDARPGSIGQGIPGVRISVLDDESRPVQPGEVGEIVAQGENIMQGYWRDAEETREVLRPEGLRTGDLARVDEDGFIYIVSRKTDMIKSGAYRINPAEIEEILLEQPNVAEVAVVGLPDDILGERPMAFVVLSPLSNKTAPTEAEMVAFCNERLPRYKAIRRVSFVDALEKTASGKVKRSAMRSIATDALAAINGPPV